MMLMMLAALASIISIIGARFSNLSGGEGPSLVRAQDIISIICAHGRATQAA